MTLSQANDLVETWHRHHRKIQGHRFSIGVERDGVLHGAAIVGRPVGRWKNQYRIAEVTRLVTDGEKNACSMLYAAAARAAKAMGYDRIQTYTLDEEPGTSLRAAGWEFGGYTTSPVGGWQSRDLRVNSAAEPQGPKQFWFKELQ